MHQATCEIRVEIPRGSQNKYRWDEQVQRLRLDRVLHASIHYPADYGLVMGTARADGRPLRALLLVTSPTFPGCVVQARPIGVLRTTDDRGDDPKVLAVPLGDPRLSQYRSLAEVPPHYLREIEYFFRAYKELEGKPVDVHGWGDVAEVASVISRWMQA